MINFEALEDMIRINEQATKIRMSTWIHNCGTHGCLCGNYALVHREFLRGRGLEFIDLRKHLGITTREFAWLFTSNPLPHIFIKDNYPLIDRASPAAALSGQEALARLKKFVAYKRDKATVSVERGRHISGTNICHRLSLGV